MNPVQPPTKRAFYHWAMQMRDVAKSIPACVVPPLLLDEWMDKNLLVHLRSLGHGNFDPFEGIPEEDVCLEGLLELSVDLDYSNEDDDIIID